MVTDLIGLHEGEGDVVGTLGFADEMLALAACPIWGVLSDRVGVRHVSRYPLKYQHSNRSHCHFVGLRRWIRHRSSRVGRVRTGKKYLPTVTVGKIVV